MRPLYHTIPHSSRQARLLSKHPRVFQLPVTLRHFALCQKWRIFCGHILNTVVTGNENSMSTSNKCNCHKRQTPACSSFQNKTQERCMCIEGMHTSVTQSCLWIHLHWNGHTLKLAATPFLEQRYPASFLTDLFQSAVITRCKKNSFGQWWLHDTGTHTQMPRTCEKTVGMRRYHSFASDPRDTIQ